MTSLPPPVESSAYPALTPAHKHSTQDKVSVEPRRDQEQGGGAGLSQLGGLSCC